MSLRRTGPLEGKHLTIGTIDLPPYIIFDVLEGADPKNLTAETVRIDGFVHQITQYFSKSFRFKYTYELPRDLAFGAVVNGTWNGVIGMVVRNEADMGATGMTITEARRTVVDFTVPFHEDPLSLLIPYPEVDGYPLEGMAKPYSLHVWCLIGLSILACAFILAFIFQVESTLSARSTYKNNLERLNNHFWTSFWSLFRVIVNADNFSTNTLPVRITFGVWCFMSIIFVNAYQGNLVANLTATKQKTMIDSIEDLVRMFSSSSQEVHYMVKKNTAFESAVLAATSGPLAIVRENLLKHPENALSRDLINVTNLVAVSKRTFAQERSAHLVRINNDFKATGQCRLSIAKKPYDVSRAGLALPKSSSLTSAFNQEIYRLREYGLLDYWLSLYTPQPNRCLAPLLGETSSGNRPTNVADNSRRKLTLSYLFGAFLLLSVGLSASFLAFLYELVSGVKRRVLRKRYLHKVHFNFQCNSTI